MSEIIPPAERSDIPVVQPVEDIPAPLDDRTLMQAIALRDQDALMQLYARHGAALYGLALRVLGIPSSAEEVIQDVFIKIWNQPARWDPALGRLSSWLLTTTRNAAIDRLRQERRHWHPVEIAEPSEELLGALDAQDAPLWAEGQLLRQIIATLPYQQRQLVELAFYGGHSHSELAQMLDLPLGTVKTRLRAAIQALRAGWMEANQPRAQQKTENPARNVHG